MTRAGWLAGGVLVAGALAVAVAARAADHGTPLATGPCRAHIHHDVLPVWLRGGFTGPEPRVPYAIGAHGQVGAVVFGWPLRSPPAPTRSNKILWVPRTTARTIEPFWIRMQRMEGSAAIGAPVRTIITTGPGPSIVDVPSAGCWRLSFAWSGRTDTLDLDYTPPG